MVALGRRIPPVMVGIVLLATASFSPALTACYYLVFALPIAALVVRDPGGPPGSGIFDRLKTLGDRRHAVGVCVSFAAALTIAYVALAIPYEVPIAGQTGDLRGGPTTHVVDTTVSLTPLLWLIACAAIIVSYNHRPAPDAWMAASTTSGSGEGELSTHPRPKARPPLMRTPCRRRAHPLSPMSPVARRELGDWELVSPMMPSSGRSTATLT